MWDVSARWGADHYVVRVHIDPESDVFPYRQLADQLRQAIKSGEYAPGRRIPSLNQLVGESGLALETVRRAVGVLVD